MPSSACKLPIRSEEHTSELQSHDNLVCRLLTENNTIRSEEHTSELQSHDNLVCRLLLETNNERPTSSRRCSVASCCRCGWGRDRARGGETSGKLACWRFFFNLRAPPRNPHPSPAPPPPQ